VIHRDLKPENMLIDESDRIKISDFGVSHIVEDGSDEIQNTAGSNYFFAPEICAGNTYKGTKSDIWALGVTLYFMVYRRYPFTASNIPLLYTKIMNDEPDYQSKD
jgi:calcium/calmodulin-dependent protein kinase kinase 2